MVLVKKEGSGTENLVHLGILAVLSFDFGGTEFGRKKSTDTQNFII
jgi:hypothetical protein